MTRLQRAALRHPLRSVPELIDREHVEWGRHGQIAASIRLTVDVEENGRPSPGGDFLPSCLGTRMAWHASFSLHDVREMPGDDFRPDAPLIPTAVYGPEMVDLAGKTLSAALMGVGDGRDHTWVSHTSTHIYRGLTALEREIVAGRQD